jgi:hypothetical protein
MAYFKDLSDYDYLFTSTDTKTIGWLAKGHDFERAAPTEELLERLWAFCGVSVLPTRGRHHCEFCPIESASVIIERGDKALIVGDAEIRAFALDGISYAAPTLIYHYVQHHSYRPPQQFIDAMKNTAPPDPDYIAHLEARGLAWTQTSTAPPPDKRVFTRWPAKS